MKYRLEHRPLNNKGHTSFRPWRVEDSAGELVATYTTREIALCIIDLLNAGEVCTRHIAYRRLRHGA